MKKTSIGFSRNSEPNRWLWKSGKTGILQAIFYIKGLMILKQLEIPNKKLLSTISFRTKPKVKASFSPSFANRRQKKIPCPLFLLQKSKAAKRKDKKGGATPSLVSKEHLNIAKNWLNEEKLPGYIVSVEGTKIQVFPQQYVDELAAMKQSLKIVSAGVGIGEVKGKDLIPGHALAMSSVLLRQGVFATEDITYEQAIAYLRKEAIALPATAPRGYILLTYRNIPLGFVKNIGKRANNLYPQEWRIRSGYLPDEIKTL